jgi:NodT family efflux transporter outer membrane factor (OMF) lipoprotein
MFCVAACAVGPDYRKPAVQIPDGFKEAAEWQRAEANPQGSLSSTWWTEYHDEQLSELIGQALEANQSIATAEAAYRQSRAVVSANLANLFPTISASASGERSETGAGASGTGVGAGVQNTVSVSGVANWELDLWGQTRRQIESAKASAEASDAQRAGQRLSIAASVASDYFALRQADIDTDLLQRQQKIDERFLAMTQAGYAQGAASSDAVLLAQDVLETAIAALQMSQILREQYEHAIAVLTGVPPGGFSIPPQKDYAFATPAVPLSVPSQLLQRRFDVVTAERVAASANARIGVAKAAFFPTLDLSAQGGFQHNKLAQLFTVPNRFWSVGPTLAATIFDAGARGAAVREARAIYDEDVANYRQTILGAFQSVEDSLSSSNHLQQQAHAYANIYERNQKLFASAQAQLTVGAASEQSLLTQQLTLLLAEQNLKDTLASLTQSSVTLVRNLGGGWEWDETRKAAVTSAAANQYASASSTAAPTAQ